MAPLDVTTLTAVCDTTPITTVYCTGCVVPVCTKTQSEEDTQIRGCQTHTEPTHNQPVHTFTSIYTLSPATHTHIHKGLSIWTVQQPLGRPGLFDEHNKTISPSLMK